MSSDGGWGGQDRLSRPPFPRHLHEESIMTQALGAVLIRASLRSLLLYPEVKDQRLRHEAPEGSKASKVENLEVFDRDTDVIKLTLNRLGWELKKPKGYLNASAA